MKLPLSLISISILSPILCFATAYQPGDWVLYGGYRYVTSLALNWHYLYVTTTNGVICYDHIRDEWSLLSSPPSTAIEITAPDHYSNNVWFATSATLFRYEPTFEKWFSFPSPFSRPIDSLAIGRFHIWIASENKFACFFRRTNDRFTIVSQDSLHSEENMVWFKRRKFFLSKILYRYGFLAPYFYLDENLRRYQITAVVEDPFSADVWVGTSGLGVFRYNRYTWQKTHLPFGFTSENIRAIAQDGKNLWFGGQGITYWQREEKNWQYFESPYSLGLLSDRIKSILPINHLIWFGTSYGLAKYDLTEKRFTTYTIFDGLNDNDVFCLASERAYLWVGTKFGLCQLDLYTNNIAKIKDRLLNDFTIYDIGVDTFFVWVTTPRGVFQLNKEKNQWSCFNHPEGWLSFEVQKILLDEEKIWFGLKGLIICYHRQTQTWERLPAPSFIPQSDILALAADERNLWIGTNSGVVRFNKRLQNWKIYTTIDGLPDNVVQAILIDGDYVWFGTKKGAVRFYWNSPFRAE
ncbi:MAG: hypothetical protein AB1393_01320 [Candidatus Edwardsbacteria bacterium]